MTWGNFRELRDAYSNKVPDEESRQVTVTAPDEEWASLADFLLDKEWDTSTQAGKNMQSLLLKVARANIDALNIHNTTESGN